MRKWTRRAFIGTGTLVGGGLVLGVAGVAFSPSRHSVVPDGAADAGQLTTWILITPDNLITVLVPHCEMGQGAQTALAMKFASTCMSSGRPRNRQIHGRRGVRVAKPCERCRLLAAGVALALQPG